MNCRPQCQGDTIIRHKTGAKAKKKKCRKEKHLDCVDEEKLEEQENMILKITYQKCKEEKKKSGEKKHGPLTTIRCVPFSEMVMNRIKPSMATREKFLAARHLDCILGKVRTVDLRAIREELKRPRLLKRLCTEPVDRKRKRKKKGKKAKRAKSKPKVSTSQQDEAASDAQPESEDVADKADVDESEDVADKEDVEESEDVADREDVEESEKRAASREASESKDGADKPKVSSASRGSKDAKSRDSRAKSKTRKRAHPDKFWCEKMKKPVKEAPSYMSEKQFDKCESVCSFDSDVCLAGLSLTVKDKKAIAENRERVRGSSKNNEAKNDAAKK